MAGKTYTFDEVQQHRSTKSCWVVLYGHVYDVTSFLPSHPGGSKVILQLAGTDATEEYDPVHPPGTLEDNLPEAAKLGAFDESTLPKPKKESSESSGPASQIATTAPSTQQNSRPAYPIKTLSDCLNLNDIEVLATSRMKKKAWAYYFSASDDLVSKSLNNQIYQRILLRPRIFVDCSRCDLSTTLLGPTNKVGVPFYVSPAAQARLGHPDGEAGIAAACARFGAAQVISNSASQTPEQICEAGSKSSKGKMVFGWQMYVQDDRSKSEAMLARVGKLKEKGMRFVVVTLDAPVPGKREDDERSSRVGADLPVPSKVVAEKEGEVEEEGRAEPDAEGGVGRALFAGTAPDLTWKRTLPWLRKHTDLPIVLKGVQTHEDAYLASLYAPQIKAIILSNHGGRAMDTAPPAVHTLLEIRKFCPEVFSRVEVWVDGGIKRGTDVVKALCLGAKGVGIGRSPLYGLGAGGQKGVERVLEILKEETETAMRLLGVEKVEQLGLRHVNTRAVEREIFDGTGAESLEGLRSFVQSKL